jgi:hypothetical protein
MNSTNSSKSRSLATNLWKYLCVHAFLAFYLFRSNRGVGMGALRRWRSGGSWFEAIPGKKLVRSSLNLQAEHGAHACNHNYMGGRSRRITVHDCPPLPLAKT